MRFKKTLINITKGAKKEAIVGLSFNSIFIILYKLLNSLDHGKQCPLTHIKTKSLKYTC